MTKLSITTAKNIQPDQVLHCEEIKGLQLRQRKSGAYWYLYYRGPDGKQRKPALGRWPGLSIADARKAARQLLLQVAQGKDPSANKQALRSAPTVADLCARYVDEWAPEHKAKSSREIEQIYIDAHILPLLGQKHVEAVTSNDVATAMRSIKKGAHRPGKKGSVVSANRTRSLLSKMFNLAETRWNMRPKHSNPVYGVERYPEETRRRVSDATELAAIAKEIRSLAPVRPAHAAFIVTLFLTGARIGELLNAKFRDWKGDRIILSKHKTVRHIGEKIIYLPPLTIQLLNELWSKRSRRPNDLLFCGIDYKRTWNRIRKNAGCPDLRLRDARRTYASQSLSEGGASLDEIGQLFGHTDPKTTRIYTWMLDDPKRRLAERGAETVASVFPVSSLASPASVQAARSDVARDPVKRSKPLHRVRRLQTR